MANEKEGQAETTAGTLTLWHTDGKKKESVKSILVESQLVARTEDENYHYHIQGWTSLEIIRIALKLQNSGTFWVLPKSQNPSLKFHCLKDSLNE